MPNVSAAEVSDHGCQFRKRLQAALLKRNIMLVKGRQRACQFNGKVERFFRTFKSWKLALLCAFRLRPIQRRLEVYRDWYNTQRPMMTLGGRTPDQAWRGASAPSTAPVRERDSIKPAISVVRSSYRGDPKLPQLHIQIVRSVQLVA